MSTFDIKINYDFDEKGQQFFTINPQAKAALEAAAKVWETILEDEFPDIPARTAFRIVNPATGDQRNLQNVQIPTVIDDIVLFVGATELDRQESVLSKTYRLQLAPNSPTSLTKRLATQQNNDNYEPWAASIAFEESPNQQWYFERGKTVPKDRSDFFSVALNQIGHALGVQNFGAFSRKISNGAFTGTQSQAIFGAIQDDDQRTPTAVPLSPALNNLKEDLLQNLLTIVPDFPKDALFEPSIEQGKRPGLKDRVPLTALDVALLQDIGYQTDLIPSVNNSGDKLPTLYSASGIQSKITDIENAALGIPSQPKPERAVLIVPGIAGVLGVVSPKPRNFPLSVASRYR